MVANQGWYSDWYSTGWFPSVWFAPADESHLTPTEIRRVRRSPAISDTGGTDTEAVKAVPKSKKPKSPKLHLAELYKQQEEFKLKQRLIQDDEDLITLISFMVHNKVIM
jgi:hypothetical protein